MLIAVLKDKFIVLFIIIFGTISFPMGAFYILVCQKGLQWMVSIVIAHGNLTKLLPVYRMYDL